MNWQITRPKVIVPRRRSNILSRRRLLAAFEDILDYKLILLISPPGYGKTTLLVDMAHQSELPVCWYSLDPLDEEPQRFLSHFIASIAQRFPEFGERSMALVQDDFQIEANLVQIINAIVNDAYDHIHEHFIMVLDDFHTVENNRTVIDFINRFIQQVDENFHLVISSRTLLSLPDLPLMVSRSQVWGLSFEELAFRPDEIQALVSQNYRLSLTRAEANALEQRTEGWITGLILSAETDWVNRDGQVLFSRISGVNLYEYWAQQVLERQPPEVRDALLRTSLLDEFNGQICGEVIGKPPKGFTWEKITAVLMKNNLFVQTIDDQSTWLRYHRLFRDFLRAKMAELYPKERAAILWRLAQYFVKKDEWEQAYAIYLRLEDYDAAAQLIASAGRSLLGSGRLSALADWIDRLPRQTRDSYPVLLSLRGYVAAMFGDGDEGLALLNQAAERFQALNDKERLAGVLSWRAAVHRMMGYYQTSIADSKKIIALAAEIENPDMYVAEAYRNYGLSLYRLGEIRNSVEYVEKALDTYLRIGEDDLAAQTSADLGIIFRNLQVYERAEKAYTRALDHWRETGNYVQQVSILNNLGVLVQSQGDYRRAHELFEEAMGKAHGIGYLRAESFALTSLADLYLELEAYQAARDAYANAEALVDQTEDRYLMLYILSKRVFLANQGFDAEEDPRVLLGTMAGIIGRDSSDYECGMLALTAGTLAVECEAFSEAEQQFVQAVECLSKGGKPLECAHAGFSLANLCFLRSEQDKALEHLQKAFQWLEVSGFDCSMAVLGREFKDLFVAFKEMPAVSRKIVPLLSRIEAFEKQLPGIRKEIRRMVASNAFAPPRLEIRAFGTARVEIDGKPVTGSDWMQQRIVRSLFFYLLAHPSYGVSKDVIGTVFWPESSSTRLKRQFKNAIYRLRQALGKNVVLFDGDVYWFNRELDYEYDVEIFREKLETAEKMEDPEIRLNAYQEAIELYRGDYLQDIGDGWAILERELLRRAYQDALLHAAEIRFERGEYEKALDLCEKALHTDNCMEPAYRLEMQVYDALGNRSGVVRVYKRCVNTLEKELGVVPSPQTEKLYLYLTH